MNITRVDSHSSYLSIFVGSLYDSTLASMLRQWLYRDSVKYVFFLIVVYNIVAICFQLPVLFSRIDEVTQWAVRELPVMKVENGVLQLEGTKQNFTYQYDQEMVLIIDAQRLKTNKEMMDRFMKAQTGIIFLKNKAVMNWMFRLRENPYPQDTRQLITSYTLMRWRDLFLWVLPLFLFMSNALYLIFAKSIEVLVCASLIYAAAWVKGWKTDFMLTFNLAAFALGPVMFFTFLVAGTGFQIPFFLAGYVALYIFYISRWFYVLRPDFAISADKPSTFETQ
ncbi:MAG: DUF1189 family protein [Chlamydiota bacterium]|nr:DUF1189 family protein [Chlamydiota bacterium]